jgi:hypothetical protein
MKRDSNGNCANTSSADANDTTLCKNDNNALVAIPKGYERKQDGSCVVMSSNSGSD